jgi:predicted alpha-1,6-mannanase (GH76 family)
VQMVDRRTPASLTGASAIVALVLVAVVLGGVLAGCSVGKSQQASAKTGQASASGTGAAAASPSPAGTPRQHAAAGSSLLMHRAATAFNAFGAAFYRTTARGAKYTDTVGTGTAVFWRQAELIEMTEDAYLAGHSPALKRQVVALMNGVRYQYGKTWTRRTWNDDIEWMIIAAVRAYQITGDRSYLALAQHNFDAVWARAYSPQFGGGLWWITGGAGRVQKNVTTNATAAIAAALLAQATHSRAYLTKAEQLYSWLRQTLYDPSTGAVYDNVSTAGSGGTVVDKAALTYNQGTFVGAATLLYQQTHDKKYYADALKAVTYTRDVMSKGGLLPAEAGGNGNLLGFKGIFARWALEFLRTNHIRTFDAWLQANAAAAWKHRDAQGIIGPDWSKVTSPSGLDSWGASCAVVLLEDLARR